MAKRKGFKIYSSPLFIFMILFLVFLVGLSFWLAFGRYISFGGDSSKLRFKDQTISSVCKIDGDSDIMSNDYKFRVTFVNTSDEDLKNVKVVATIKVRNKLKEIELPVFDINANSEYRMMYSVDYKSNYALYNMEASIDGGKTFTMKYASFTWASMGGIIFLVTLVGAIVGVIVLIKKSTKKKNTVMVVKGKKVVDYTMVGEENDIVPVFEDGSLGDSDMKGARELTEEQFAEEKRNAIPKVCPNCGYKNSSTTDKCDACGTQFK